MKKLVAVDYDRVSSDEQAREGFSLDVQHEKNVAYIHAQDWEYGGAYIDPGKSGKNLNRPDMIRLLSDVKRGVINIIVVHKLDRLTRNIGDLHNLLTLFDKHEVKLVSITENIDTSSAMGRMFVYMLGIFAQWFRENLSEEVYKGSIKRAELGLRNTGTAPYGYSVLPDMSLVINESEARVVRQIFEWCVQGYGKFKIASLLNSEGIDGDPIPSPKKGSVWRDAVLHTLLTNPTYKGAVHWKKKDEPEEMRIIVEGKHEPIVPLELFDEVQTIVKRKKEKSMSRSGYDFPFTTILKCAECGRAHSGQQRKDKGRYYRYYICRGKKFKECDASVISEIKLNALFVSFLNRFRFDASDMNKTIGGRDTEKDAKKLIKLIEEGMLKKKNYTRAMGSGKIDYAMFEQLVDEENEKIDKWEAQLNDVQQSLPSTKKTRKDIAQYINNLKENWNDMSYEERKVTVQTLFSAIVIKKQEDEWAIVGFKLAE